MNLTSVLRATTSAVQKLIKHDRNILMTDRYVIMVQAGNGGPGISRYNGVGGNGGDVYFVAKPNMSFTTIKKSLKGKMKIKANSGETSQKTKLNGKAGGPVFLDVPLGVEVVDAAEKRLITRCTKAFQKYLIARGGEGGHAGNMYKGEKGETVEVEVHVKLRPNIGLVGFPNAGKSTLLKAFIPEKSVKIAPYPFTTVHPQVGFWKVGSPEYEAHNGPATEALSNSFTLSIADLPGIIEGAARNRGMGHKFLKHLEYADVLLLVVDCTGFQLKNEVDEPIRNPLESIALLNIELENYDRRLTKKPAVLVLNKIDLLENKEELEKLESLRQSLLAGDWAARLPEEMRPQRRLRFDAVLLVSAMNGDIKPVKEALRSLQSYLSPLTDPPSETQIPSDRLV